MLDAGNLSIADFTAHLNGSFVIHFDPAESLVAELLEVSELGSDTGEKRQPFSIVFRSPQEDRPLSQGIYSVEHDIMGTIEIFLVPIGPDEQGMRYEAIFA
jgi:hypothetical protein